MPPSPDTPLPPPQVAARPLPIPRNGTEFEKAWRSASADADAQAQLLRALDPATLPALLKDSLTGPVLKAVLKAALGLLAPRVSVGAAYCSRNAVVCRACTGARGEGTGGVCWEAPP